MINPRSARDTSGDTMQSRRGHSWRIGQDHFVVRCDSTSSSAGDERRTHARFLHHFGHVGRRRTGAGVDSRCFQRVEEVVVTGFRSSLNSALEDKRKETAAIDSIKAEDIGKFPDSNLAESMQRVPGVTLSRGDGGEGRNISVRGLGPAFTRVRINGMEGAAQTGASDIYGAGNNGRSFDFDVFPSEIFSALEVRKTPSADVEEGSLGATADLRSPRPLDYPDDMVFTSVKVTSTCRRRSISPGW